MSEKIIGIKVRHYSNSFRGEKPSICRDYGESNTDKSSYRPDISVARAYQGAMTKRLVYDFDDGKDNGEVVQTFIRSKGLDITEIDTATKRVMKIIEDKKESDSKSKKDQEERDKFLKDLGDAVKGQESSENSSEDSQ